MELSNLPDISFADCDEETVKKELIDQYENVSGRTLASSDPVRLFLLAIANVIIIQRNLIDHTGKMNLLAYATGNYLDHLGALLDVKRIAAKPAEVTLAFTVSTTDVGAILIPKGTRVTTQDEKAYFSLNENLVIPEGQTEGTGSATCTEVGELGNGIPIGGLNKLVDPLPYISNVKNTTASAGGGDTESDDLYRARIHEAPESFSDAGSYGAYVYWAKTANADITDVYVTSPSAGEVKIVPLLSGGTIPEQEVLDKVLSVCSAEKVRPLTDHVTVAAPTSAKYNIAVSYSIASADKAHAVEIQNAVKEAVNAYILWQREKLGRDIDPSKLYALMVSAGAVKVAVTSPLLTEVDSDMIGVADAVSISFGGLDSE